MARLIIVLGLAAALFGCSQRSTGAVTKDASEPTEDATVDENTGGDGSVDVSAPTGDATVGENAGDDGAMAASCPPEYAYANLLWDENEQRPGTHISLEDFCANTGSLGCPQTLNAAASRQDGAIRCRITEGCGKVMFGADNGTHGVLFVFEENSLVGAARHGDLSYSVAGCQDGQFNAGVSPPVPQAWAIAAAASPNPPLASTVCSEATITDFACDAADLSALTAAAD